eukprot:scaffold147100_cov21-Tisochrysis_lutea.AAC.2
MGFRSSSVAHACAAWKHETWEQVMRTCCASQTHGFKKQLRCAHMRKLEAWDLGAAHACAHAHVESRDLHV